MKDRNRNLDSTLEQLSANFGWATCGPKPIFAGPVVGQTPFLLGQLRANAGPLLGHVIYNALINRNKNKINHDNSKMYQPIRYSEASKRPYFVGETPLQLQLRMVCGPDRPIGAKPPLMVPILSNRFSGASHLAKRFGSAAQLLVLACALALPAHSDGWAPISTGAAWSSADRFSTAPAAASTSPQTTRRTVPFVRAVQQSQGPAMDRLLTLISQAESPVRGYDAVHHQATVKPPKPPSQMTIAEIQTWVRATPGQPHAIGRNQIIPATFNRVVRALGLSGNTVYNRRTQDMMGRFLIEEAGYTDFVNGRISRDRFMDRLAAVWAGLPLPNGRSVYHGYAGNRATISRSEYTSAMAAIFPVRSASN